MGCSPSKGKLFSKPEALELRNAPPAEAPQVSLDQKPEKVEDTCLKPDVDEELQLVSDECCLEEVVSNSPVENLEDVREPEVTPLEPVAVNNVPQTDEIKTTERQKKSRCKKRSANKQKKSSIIRTKVEFPPQMIRAHQAAYTFLNPNISKYEILLGLLDNAAQTQMSLQPMMTALVLHFEEINQALEEMAEEGELMLKEHGDYMALPSGMITQPVRSVKISRDSPDPPPDLLQQLLQHSAEKMKLVGGSVQTVGNKTLEEAVEYFSSLSKMMAGKLKAKQKAEQRLAQVLARVEGAAIRKSNPEDTALHSEDSGIGGENDSLTGTDRHRRHRGSAGSGSSGSGANVQAALDPISGNSTNELMEVHDKHDDEDEDEDDEDEDEDEQSERSERKRSSSYPADASQANYMLQRSQQDLDHKMPGLQEIKESESPHHGSCRTGPRRHSLNAPGGVFKSPIRRNKPACSLTMLTSHPSKRHSVRRLINNFSQGVDGRPGQSLANLPPHIKRPNKNRMLLLSDTVAAGSSVVNDNHNNNSWPDSRDDLDEDSLPPPPPEVLMDNSFQSNEDEQENEDSQDDSAHKLPIINQRATASQKLRVSMQNVDVLPNKATVRTRPVPPCRSLQPDMAKDQEAETVNCLYQQARKIIHLQNAVKSPDRRNVELKISEASPLQTRMSHKPCDPEMPTCSLPVIAPPVSRVRLPPSCPSVCHHLPSPPSFRPQSTSRPSSRPSSPRTVTRPTNNLEDIIPSVSFQDARSVFLRNELQNSENCLSSGSSLPTRQWGEPVRGRLTTRQMESSTRRTQSEQRPYGSSHSETPADVGFPSISSSGRKSLVSK